MPTTQFLGTGHYVPERIVTNEELAAQMDTSDAWIRERTGIEERRYVDHGSEVLGSSDLGTRASLAALRDAGVPASDIDCIIFATLSPDRAFPGDGVTVQANLDIPAGVPSFDIRAQCSGFLYGLQMADAFIRSGTYRRILLVGAEVHSTGLDFSDKGRDVTVIFGDGGAAVVLGPGDDNGVLSIQVHADGRHAENLRCDYPSSKRWPRIAPDRPPVDGEQFPAMQGRRVFKHAVVRMPEVVSQACERAGVAVADLKLLIPHQANLRISEAVQKRLELRDDQVFNNIQKYGNTTACSIPLALDQAVRQGRIQRGDLVCLAAFGAGFTWGASVIRW